jgi:hypothetical protein
LEITVKTVTPQPSSPELTEAALERAAAGRRATGRGFTNPESARLAAIAFASEGISGAEVRKDADGDPLSLELADALDALAAGM